MNVGNVGAALLVVGLTWAVVLIFAIPGLWWLIGLLIASIGTLMIAADYEGEES